MEKKQRVIDNPITVDGITIIPIVHILLNSYIHSDGAFMFGRKQPDAIIVVSPAGKRAFRITGEEVPLDQIVDDIPELETLLN